MPFCYNMGLTTKINFCHLCTMSCQKEMCNTMRKYLRFSSIQYIKRTQCLNFRILPFTAKCTNGLSYLANRPSSVSKISASSDRFHQPPHFFGSVREISEAQYMEVSNTFMVLLQNRVWNRHKVNLPNVFNQ